MTREELYDIWAPENGAWSQWVKPVLFAHLRPDAAFIGESPDGEAAAFSPFIPESDGKTALILDLPGPLAAKLSVPLAQCGYRPIPLYNSCPPSAASPVHRRHAIPSAQMLFAARMAAIDVDPILDAIATASCPLREANLPPTAPPAFLLDSQRRTGDSTYHALPGTFDNRSISLPTDFPSSHLLFASGIRRAILLQQSSVEPQVDLSHTLLRWQQAGIAIESLALDSSPHIPQLIEVRRPPLFRRAWYAFTARLGLRPHPLGGFGGTLPIPSAG